jgi:hypothetical protein
MWQVTVLPLVVFPQKNMQFEITDGTPLGFTYACDILAGSRSTLLHNGSGTLFQLKPTVDDTDLIIHYGHFSYQKS